MTFRSWESLYKARNKQLVEEEKLEKLRKDNNTKAIIKIEQLKKEDIQSKLEKGYGILARHETVKSAWNELLLLKLNGLRGYSGVGLIGCPCLDNKPLCEPKVCDNFTKKTWVVFSYPLNFFTYSKEGIKGNGNIMPHEVEKFILLPSRRGIEEIKECFEIEETRSVFIGNKPLDGHWVVAIVLDKPTIRPRNPPYFDLKPFELLILPTKQLCDTVLMTGVTNEELQLLQEQGYKGVYGDSAIRYWMYQHLWKGDVEFGE